MNPVDVGMYNAAHMLAQAIAAAGSTETDKVRDALRGSTFAKAPQGSLTMQKEDHQAVLPSYLMKVRPGWTSVNDMFEQSTAPWQVWKNNGEEDRRPECM